MGYRCPNCGHGGVAVDGATRELQALHLDKDGEILDERVGDVYFEDSTPAHCTECGYHGQVIDFVAGEKK